MDFRQSFVIGASWDKDELIRFWDQKVTGQGRPALDAAIKLRLLVPAAVVCTTIMRILLHLGPPGIVLHSSRDPAEISQSCR